MERPERREEGYLFGRTLLHDQEWNKCCEKWEKFLPSEIELQDIVLDNLIIWKTMNQKKKTEYLAKGIMRRHFVAKAIYNRIHKGKG